MDELEHWQTYQQWEEYQASLVKNPQKESTIQLNPQKIIDFLVK